MKTRFLAFLLLPFTALCATTPPAAMESTTPKPDRLAWLKDLLPTSMQKNPRVQTTVFTEMTPAGKKLPPVTPAKPAYFVIASKGAQEMGDPIAGEKAAKMESVERALVRSLAQGGYLPATLPEHPPTLLLVYIWGSHNIVPDSANGNEIVRGMLERATLVGGDKFARELGEAIRRSENFALTTRERVPEGFTANYSPETLAFMDPLNIYRMESNNNEVLLDHATSELYFVQVIAYDFAGVMAKKRVPLWRTNMTLPSQGLTQEMSLPSLVFAAGPHFGKEMNSPALIQRRVVPDGKVEVGTPTVMPSNTAK